MKTLMKKALTALAFAVGLTTAAQAETDELGLTPKHWYKFDNTANLMESSGATALGTPGEATANFIASGHGYAFQVKEGSHPYGGGLKHENGNWSIGSFVCGSTAKDKSAIWSIGSSTASPANWLALAMNGSGSVRVCSKAGDLIVADVADACLKYHYYMLTKDGTTLTLYVDGVSKGTATFDVSMSDNYQFGSLHGGGLNRGWGNAIDDWRLYQQVLTAEQIQTIAAAYPAYANPNRAISLNFRSGVASVGGVIGYEPVAGWNNLGGSGTDVALTDSFGQNTNAKVTFSGGNYQWGDGDVDAELRGYMDDGSQISIVVSDIPFEAYKVIIYQATDSSGYAFNPPSVNGVYYTYKNSAMTIATSQVRNSTDNVYGAARSKVPVLGTNVLVIDKEVAGAPLSGNLNIQGAGNANTARGGISAIQIVQVPNVVINKEYTASDASDVTISFLNDYVKGGDEPFTGVFTLNLTGGNLVYDEAFDCAALIVNSTGDVSVVTDGTYEVSAAEADKVNCGSVAGTITWGIPRTSLATRVPEQVYAADSGTAAAPIALTLNTADGKMTLKDGTFYLGRTDNGTQSYVTFTNATIKAIGNSDSPGLGVGKATFTIAGTSQVTAERLVLVQGGASRTATLTVKDDAQVTVTGSTIVDSNQSTIMFGHWNGSSTFNLQDNAVVSATNAQILVGKTGNTQTINISGGVLAVKGIKASGSASSDGNTLNISGGELRLGMYGITTYNSNKRIAVNVTGDATITATDPTLEISQAVDIAADKTLTIVLGEGKRLTIDPAKITGEGTVRVSGGIVAVGGVRDFSELSKLELVDGAVFMIEETADEFNAGEVVVSNVAGGVSVLMFRADWTTVELEPGQDVGSMVFHDYGHKISGPATWLDYTFTAETRELRKNNNGYIDNAGSAGKNKTLQYDTNYNAANSYNEENGSLLGKSTPWRDMSGDMAWPSSYTVAVYANVPDVEKGCIVGFGSSSSGNSYVAIVRGETSDQILLMKGTTSSAKAEVLATMAADNATSAKHLVVFTNDGTTFAVYCDGIKVAEKPAFSLGTGFQVGSVHGGVAPSASYKGKDYTGITRVSEIEDAAIKSACEIGAIRVFNRVISAAEMDQLTTAFPYVSKGGLYVRTISDDAALSATEAWTDSQSAETKVDLPEAKTIEEITYKPSIAITTTSEATLTLNATLAADKITFGGNAKLTVTAEGANHLTAAGAVVVNAPIAISYGEVDIMSSPLQIGAEGSIELDVASLNIDVSKVYKATYWQLTGLTSEAPGKITLVNAPEGGDDHAVDLVFQDGQYWLRVAPSRAATTLYIVEGTETIFDDTLFRDGAGNLVTRFPEDTVAVDCPVTLALTNQLVNPITSIKVVMDGVLKFADWSYTGEVVVENCGHYDINGMDNNAVNLVLAGGRLMNSGDPTAYDHIQNNRIAVTDNSFIEAQNTLMSVANGWNFFDFNLNGNQIEKVGDAEYRITAGRFVGGGTLWVGIGTLTLDGMNVPADTTLSLVATNYATLKFSDSKGRGFAKAGTRTVSLAENATIAFANNTSGLTNDLFIAEDSFNVDVSALTLGADPIVLMTAPGVDLTQATLILPTGVSGYQLAYADNVLTVERCPDVTFAVPTMTGATASISGYEIVDGSVTVPYGAAITVTYTADVGKLFSDGTNVKTVDVASVTDAQGAIDAINAEIAGVTPVVAPIKIGSAYYLTMDAAIEAYDGTAGDITLCLDYTVVGINCVEKNLRIDVAGKVLTFASDEILLKGDVTIVNTGDAAGGVKNYAQFTIVPEKTLDLSTLSWGAGLIGTEPAETTAAFEIAYSAVIKMGYVEATWSDDFLKIVTTDNDYKVVVTKADGVATISAQQAGPTPIPGGGTIEPVPGEDGVYIATPSDDGEVTIDPETIGEDDIIRIVDTRDVMVTGVPVDQIEVKLGGILIQNTAFVGGDVTGFSTALSKDGYVVVEEDPIPVVPTLIEATEEEKPFVIGEEVEMTIRAIPGLTYDLIRDTVVGGTYETSVCTETAGEDETTITLVDEIKPAGSAFYKVKVTK